MYMFHVKKPWALRISDRYLYNNCIQGDSLFLQYDEIPGTPCLPPLTLGFCCVFPQKNQFTVFPGLLHQPDLISTVLFVRKME